MKTLLDALDARSGLVCVVGAGGKKTTLYRLAGQHPGRVGVTATVHIPFFPKNLPAAVVIAPPEEIAAAVLAEAGRSAKVAFAHPSEKHGRHAGLEPELVTAIGAGAGFDVVLVKADGARGRLIKAPNESEPRIPKGVSTVIPVVSARVIDEPLTDRIAHRVERVAAVCGMTRGERLTPGYLARLLSDGNGALHGVGDARVIPLVNMVDDAEREALAFETAERALGLTRRFDRVVLACMRGDDPLVRIVER